MKIYGKTDVGKVRSKNQDTFAYKVINDELAYAIVCDGMGGGQGGEIASSMVCEIVQQKLDNSVTACKTTKNFEDLLFSAINDANIEVYEKSISDKLEGMGTTIVAIIWTPEVSYIAHVGDSRAYLLHNGKLVQITKDHSLVQALVDDGQITEDEMQNHPVKNLITRAVGVECMVDVDITSVEETKGSCFLLCTDGLTNMCSDKAISQMIVDTKEQYVVDTLIIVANNMGGFDNITAVYIKP